MNTKTIKLQPGEYTDFQDEFEQHDLIILTGARGSGKSYPVAHRVSEMLERDENAKFIYMRISDKELATFESWCKDLNLQKLAGATDVKLKRGKPTKGDICLMGFDDEGLQISERVIGKCVSLESSALFKSGKYDEFECVVFEEYTQRKMNPNNEKSYVFNFLENVVSIFRDRPKRIFIIGNSLKNIPLLDRAIDELTGEMFDNPLKVKIFRQGKSTVTNNFLSYLNGEQYDEEDFTVNIDEFFIIYTNRDFVIKQHKVYNRKHYVTANKNNRKILYSEPEILRLVYFCRASPINEFYYQTPGVEKAFTQKYAPLLAEITKFISDKGSKFLL